MSRGGLSARAVAGLLWLYKRKVSPHLPRACRFSPTCSEYGRIAILKHGLLRGGAKTLARLARCQPFCAGGVDLP